jgi:ATP-binding cassette subfamily B protein
MKLQKQYGFIWLYLKQYRSRLLMGIAAIVARDLVVYTIPLFIREGVNTLTHSKPSVVSMSVVTVSLCIAMAAVLRFSFQTASRLSLMTTSRNVEYHMRRDMLRHLFCLDSTFWARTRVGDAMAYATNDLNAVRMMVGPGATGLSESLVALPLTLGVMISVDWRLTLAALLPAPLAIWIVTRAGGIIRRRFHTIQSIFSSMSAAVQQTVSGVRVVRAFVQEKFEIRRFEAVNRSYARANRDLAVYISTLDPLLVFITGISVLIVLWYGGSKVLVSKMDVGNFVMFTTYTTMLARPFSSLGRATNMIQRGMASVGRLQSLFSEEPKIASAHKPELAALREGPLGSIRFDHVTVRYGSLTALHAIDLEAAAGSTLAILGPTGSGKSTLARLVPRLIDATEGHVFIDGVDCRNMDLNELRSRIAVVPQETFLFSATLSENIAIGNEHATDQEIQKAAEIAGLSPDIQVFQAGLNTVVGERGIMLSGGQKMRISLARAILREPSVLILDDTLSSVDALTAQYILEQLQQVTSLRTTILISHRVATAKYADQIVVLDNGKVVERGTHAGLIVGDGYYARLAGMQNIECELETL